MSNDTIDPHAAKLLSDLLALVLSDDQGDAAIGAIRRRAARDGISAGALKHVANQLLSNAPLDGRRAARELTDLQRIIADRTRELDRSRDAQQRAEAALGNVQRANQSLAANVGRLRDGQRMGWQLGFLLGVLVAAAGFLAFGASTRYGAGPAQRYDRVARAQVADYLHNCFISSTNSLAGTPYATHLLIEFDADGRITEARLAQDQTDGNTADEKIYSSLLLRTLNEGGCGSLPLPSSLRGKPGRLDLYLPR